VWGVDCHFSAKMPAKPFKKFVISIHLSVAHGHHHSTDSGIGITSPNPHGEAGTGAKNIRPHPNSNQQVLIKNVNYDIIFPLQIDSPPK
jgi:hypothetical protein